MYLRSTPYLPYLSDVFLFLLESFFFFFFFSHSKKIVDIMKQFFLYWETNIVFLYDELRTFDM